MYSTYYQKFKKRLGKQNDAKIMIKGFRQGEGGLINPPA